MALSGYFGGNSSEIVCGNFWVNFSWLEPEVSGFGLVIPSKHCVIRRTLK
jgi:hypothetical protein